MELPVVLVNDFSEGSNPSSQLEDVTLWTRWKTYCAHQQVDSGLDDDDDDDYDDNGDDGKDIVREETVALPTRYSRFTDIILREGIGLAGKSREGQNVDEPCSTIECRERDMGVALRWIRQQMSILRRQNKAIVRQFTDLRAGILQMRYAGGITHGSLSDLSSVGVEEEEEGEKGSNASLMDRLTVDNGCGPAAGQKSVSLPSSPMVVRASSRRRFEVSPELNKSCGGSVWGMDGGGGGGSGLEGDNEDNVLS